MEADFSGEQFIPGKTSKRIAEDHLARYTFALPFVRDKAVLDIACGSGYGSQMLRDKGAASSVDGVDISENMIQYARAHFLSDNVIFTASDLIDYSSQKSYDVITSFETIEHIDDYKKGLQKLHSLLIPGGTLLVSTPNRIITSYHSHSLEDKPENPYHFREFTVDELKRELMLCGFIVHDDDVYGHRQQRYFKNRYLRRLYKMLFNPDVTFSPQIQRLYAQPRSFLVVARKAH